MRLSKVEIENFRAHTATEIPLEQLGCLIGENNAGKSSVLHALQFAFDERRLDDQDFHYSDQHVKVTVHIDDITESDLERVSENHRAKVSGILNEGKLTIVRTQALGSKAESKYLKMTPANPSWNYEHLAEAIKRKSGPALRKAAVDIRPELDTHLSEKPKQDEVNRAWQALVEDLPKDQLKEEPADFPTGIYASIKPLLPSIIYIPAVKDASSETKATGTAAFARLLGMLFDEVQDQFQSIESEFEEVHKKLSRHLNSDGDMTDERLPAVQRIEAVIEEYVGMSFPGIRINLNVPAPTLSLLLDNADLQIDDGHVGGVITKGDGLQRTVLFALLRAYNDMRYQGLNESQESDSSVGTTSRRSYLLLFEEPELYLHPRAQRQLMSALAQFAKDHQVLVTTHSPGFFQPGTKGFTRLYKTTRGVCAKPVDLVDMSLRDAYQIIRHENNEAAFFAKLVVLVEGDSDTFVFPHLAKLFSRDWDDVERGVMFVKIGGKGNITRYRDFFENFDVPVHVITDLDALSDGFNHLTSTQTIKESHSHLMSKVNTHLPEISDTSTKKAKNIAKTNNARELWATAQQNFATWQVEKSDSSAQGAIDALTELFHSGHSDARLKVISEPPTKDIEQAVDEVISSLAQEGTYVLRRGDLEDYCGSSVDSKKVDAAIAFCSDTTSIEKLKQIHGSDAENVVGELQHIFSNIFRNEESPVNRK